jgi:ATP synthase protein I
MAVMVCSMSFPGSAQVGSRPVRIVLGWQGLLTAAAVALAANFAGIHGAVSAGLGGAIGMAAALLFAAVTAARRGRTAEEVLATAFKAEAVKIVFIVAALWLVLALYGKVVAVALIGTFVATTVVSSLAFFVSNRQQ